MRQAPAIILLAPPKSDRSEDGHAGLASPVSLSGSDTLVATAMSTGLPVLMVTCTDAPEPTGSLLAGNDILQMPPIGSLGDRRDWMARAMAAGVLTRSNAQGWIFVPVDLPMVQTTTLLSVARALPDGPLVFPCFQHLRGRILGAGPELHGELVRLRSDHDLRRLLVRFPASDVGVNDPGVHMARPVGLHALASPQRNGVVSSPW